MRDRLSTGPDIKGIRIREKRFSFGSFDLVHDSSQKDWEDVSSISLFTEVELEGYQILFVDFFLKIDTVQKQVNPVEDCLPRMDSEVGKKDRTRHFTSSASIAILTLGARGVKESQNREVALCSRMKKNRRAGRCGLRRSPAVKPLSV